MAEDIPDVAAAIDGTGSADVTIELQPDSPGESPPQYDANHQSQGSMKISVTGSPHAGNTSTDPLVSNFDENKDIDTSKLTITSEDTDRKDNNTDTNSTRPMLKSTLGKQQQSWIDPYEPAITDTFYHKELKNLRPNFANVQMAITKMETELNALFEAGPSAIQDGSESADEDGLNPAQRREDEELNAADDGKKKAQEKSKFGAWDGVFAGCILNIFGVIMFLRVGWIVGQAGILQAILIILISSVVTFLTTLSMSAICTNGTILGGGAYYIISRSLGPGIGGSVGVLFAFGNMVAVSMYLIGFAETLVDNLPGKEPLITGDKVGDVRIWSNVVLVFELILALVGLKYVIKANLGLLVFIIITILCFFIGSFYQTQESGGEEIIMGVDGWTNGNLDENLKGVYEDGYDFWGVLSIFFPAVTGIMAGANISGDLRNPSHDIPLGTLTAVGLSTVVYCIMALFVGAVTARSELLDNYTVMKNIAVWDGIVLIGIYAATLSSGIAALVGAPRILQAVAQDNLIPALKFFAKTDKEGNPVRGYFLSFAVAAGCNCIGQLNFVAPLISEFFMIAYLMINFACFALEMSKSPGWRPSFQFFNAASAFSGFAMCLGVMFLIDWVYALIAVVFGIGLFLYIDYTDPDVKWGSVTASRTYYEVYKALLRLRKQKLHIKNWRPAILCLTHDPVKQPQLVMYCQTLKKGYGPFFFGTVYNGDYRVNIQKFHHAHNDGYLPPILRSGFSNGRKKKFCKGFYEAILAETFRGGCQNLFQLVGVGNLRPNTVMIGFKHNWQNLEKKVNAEYVQVLRDALQMRMGLIICVGLNKINWTHHEFVPAAVSVDYNAPKNDIDTDYMPSRIIRGAGSEMYDQSGNNLMNRKEKKRRNTDDPFNYRSESQNEAAYRRTSDWVVSQSEPMIDVWWLLDDGGLMLLLPHIMRQHQFWQFCKLRITLVADKDDVNTDVQVIEDLIQKFRLPFETPRVILVEDNEPTKKTIAKFERLGGTKVENTPRPSVTRRWLKFSELLFEHSRYAGMCIVTLPLPTATFDATAYLALLECMCDQKRMPPMLIMRGNGESSLTFYSE